MPLDMKRLDSLNTLVIACVVLWTQSAFALFRGDEYQPRDWWFDSEYIIDTVSFQFPRRIIRRHREERNAYRIAGGSVRSADAWLVQNLKLKSELDGPWDFGFVFEAGEDFDGVYQHHRLILETSIGGDWYWYGTGEPLAEKEYSDLGFGLRFGREQVELDFTFLWPNLYWNEKNQLDSWVEKRPIALLFDGEIPVGEGLLLPWWDLDLPSRYRFDTDAFYFTFEKYRVGLDYEYEMDGDSFFWAGLSMEHAVKRRWGYVPGDPSDYSVRRDAARFQAEFEKPHGEKDSSTFGVLYHYFNEDKPFPNDPASSRFILRHDYTGYYLWTHRVNEKWWITTGLYGDWVDLEELYPGDPASDVVVDEMLWKIPLMFTFPGSRGELTINGTLHLNPWKFGGGNIIFSTTF